MVAAVPARIGEERPHRSFASGPAIVLYLASAKLLLHLLTAARYDIFRDELYYVACSKHLAWGYVDHPPMNVFIAWFARHVFGESALGLRLLPAIAGAALVWMTGQLTREMGGNRFVQALSALAIIPVIDFYGPRYGLPAAISKRNTYWSWGPRGYTGDIVIVLGSDGSGDREHFRSVQAAGRVEHPYSRRDEQYTIWLCRGLNQDLRQMWPGMKTFD